MAPTLVLNPGREKSMLRRHPWVFSGAVAEVTGSPAPGETVAVRSASGDFLGWAAFSPQSQIRGRVWSWDQAEKIDAAFFYKKLAAAIASRRQYYPWAFKNPEKYGLRLAHAESDGLPGIILDRYGPVLVMQLLSAGAEIWRDALLEAALELTGARTAYERSDADVRQLEGLPTRCGLMSGELPESFEIDEDELRFTVDIAQGHKTGFYLDQRFNRTRVRQLAEGKEVLDCFSYTGGFTLSALAGGASSVLSVEASGEAIAGARRNLELNRLPAGKVDWLEGDVFHVLRSFRDARRSFDLIVLDPPKFAQTAAQAERAARGYKDINLLAFKLLRPGGILVTFSCSGGVSQELFQKIVAGAALDAGIDAAILERLTQAPDHPVALNFPEGAYLKGLVIQRS
ncbi:MAG TPA: class I SAM-dependent methyltransferase [Anaerolineales bacterium]